MRKKKIIKKSKPVSDSITIKPKSFNLTIKELYDILNVIVVENTVSVGVDVAQNKTGVCILRTDTKKLYLDDFYLVDVKGNTKGNLHARLADYSKQVCIIAKKLSEVYSVTLKRLVIIEDCWLGFSVWTTKVLAKFAAISFISFLNFTDNIPDPIGPLTARSGIGFKQDKGEFTKNGTKKIYSTKPAHIKEQIKSFIYNKLCLTIEEDNLADAFVLALYGLIKKGK